MRMTFIITLYYLSAIFLSPLLYLFAPLFLYSVASFSPRSFPVYQLWSREKLGRLSRT